MRILCVAEKPSIAKAVASSLSNGSYVVRDSSNQYIKNYEFTYNFRTWGNCQVTMTSVLGHLTSNDFEARYKHWSSVDPRELFVAPIQTSVTTSLETVSRNISKEARMASKLFIWTDCDREGEHIGWEIANVAKGANRGLRDTDITRAVFNNVEASHVREAADNPQPLDMKMVRAVEARIEIDLRIGAAFTRFQTLTLQNHFRSELDNKVISYGSCQFPTLGFIVDQYKRVKNFVPEKFWYLQIEVKIPAEFLNMNGLKEEEELEPTRTATGRKKKSSTSNAKPKDSLIFNWERVHLFDHLATTVLFEQCADTGYKARVVSVVNKPTSKWRPLPLTTVELQKLGATFFGLSSKRIMEIAESLYNKGYISYPRTETDQFDSAMDLQALVRKQYMSPEWGEYAKGLLGENSGPPSTCSFTTPRKGRNNDKAHPPIHPVIFVARSALESNDHYEVYKFITRRFLACCSPDALGSMTTVTLAWGGSTQSTAAPGASSYSATNGGCGERFKASGLVVHERNFLDVYPYQKWESSSTQIPPGMFEPGIQVDLHSADIREGSTTAPTFLTEPELIALMDLNGIGTDATMAEHIDTILVREYVFKHFMTGDGGNGGRGGRGGRGSTRGGTRRGGRGRSTTTSGSSTDTSSSSSSALPVFIPSTLGIALVEGYDEIGFDMSLSKPFLRKEMEDSMRAIIDGRMTKQQVVSETINKYRVVYGMAKQQSGVLVRCTRRYLNAATAATNNNNNNNNENGNAR